MKSLYTSSLCLFLSFCVCAQGPALREAIRLDQAVDTYGATGEGVVVVMIDRGIDYRHPDFIDDDGNTRIAYIFDMLNDSGANAPGNPYGVGTIVTRDQINASLDAGGAPLTNDRGGHGTATTGIMVGDGSGTNDRIYQGVAPEATIISIKISQDPFPPFAGQPGQSGAFNAGNIPIALNFAHDKITELGMPSVTLMNIGSIGGPTDGTSTVCRAIDDYVEQGHPFVCGVGDDGGADNYASTSISQGETVELLVEKGLAGNLRLDLWYSEDDRFTVSIERPDGTVEGPFAPPAGPNGVADQTLGDIRLFHRGANQAFFGATSPRRELLIDNQGVPGTYKVILEGTTINGDGVFQATLNPSRSNNGNQFGSFVVEGHSINDYSSATKAISPSDYVVTTSWTNQAGNTFGPMGSQGAPGELWLGASAGPTHDGRLGIDFATPGEYAIGAYAPGSRYAFFASNIVENSNGLYGVQNAVSASAPVATGIIALMLDLNPNLNPDELLDLLHQSCVEDSFTGSVPNNDWGYGKLDALLALQNADRTVGTVNQITPVSEVQVFPNPTSDQLTIRTKDASLLQRIEMYNSTGQRVLLRSGLQSRQEQIGVATWVPGMYSVVVYRNGEVPMVGKVVIR